MQSYEEWKADKAAAAAAARERQEEALTALQQMGQSVARYYASEFEMSVIRRPPDEVRLMARNGPRVFIRSSDMGRFDIDLFMAPSGDVPSDRKQGVDLQTVYSLCETAFDEGS